MCSVVDCVIDHFCRCIGVLMSLFVCRYVRLELLQGVAAFHSGDKQASSHLSSALDKWQRLQVSDESLAVVASIGFSTSQVAAGFACCTACMLLRLTETPCTCTAAPVKSMQVYMHAGLHLMAVLSVYKGKTYGRGTSMPTNGSGWLSQHFRF